MRSGLRNVSSAGAAFLDHTRDFKLAIGAGDSIGIDHEPLGQHPHGRQLFARGQMPRCDGVLHLIDDLKIDRNAVGLGKAELHALY